MNTQKNKPKLQNGGVTRKVFKITMEEKSSPQKITVVEHTTQPVPNDGVSFDEFYKSYVSDGQNGDKKMYIAVNITEDNKIDNFVINNAQNNEVGVIVNTTGTQLSTANSSNNAVEANQSAEANQSDKQKVEANQSAEATQSDKQQVYATNPGNQQVEANQSDKQQGGNTTSVEQNDNSNRKMSSHKNGGKRNLTKRRKHRHSRK